MNVFESRRAWGPVPNYPKVSEYVSPEKEFIVIAGPCSIESTEQIKAVADFVSENGATHLRGGIFRAGTYPGSKFGYIDEGLIQDFYQAAHDYGLKTIIEVLDYREPSLQFISQYADCYQVGCRQMQNYALLRRLGASGKTIFLKRHPGSTLDEWLGAAEHLLTGGPCHPILIERGSATHSNHVRWDLSISMIPAAKALTNIPVICDASHGTGRRDLVEPMTLAGVAAGADGVLIETHPDPENSLSDADQAISFQSFSTLMDRVCKIRAAMFEFEKITSKNKREINSGH